MQPLNYSNKAIETFQSWVPDLLESQTELGPFLRSMTKYLHESQKFIFPEGGHIFEEEKWVKWAGVPLNLPYPIVAIEYPAEFYPGNTPEFMKARGEASVPSPKRIALAMTRDGLALDPGFQAFVFDYLALFDGARKKKYGSTAPYIHSDWWLLWPICEMRHEWRPSWCGAVVPLGDESVDETGIKKDFVPVVLPSLLAQSSLREVSADVLHQYVLFDLKDELIAMKQLCQVLGCENMTTKVLDASPKLNKARAKKGHLPLYDYHVLVVKTDQHNPRTDNTLGGNHASPRFHWRRGHIRKLPTGKNTWVRSCAVGQTEMGIIEKDYVVT